MPVLVTVSGMVGSGKSTVVEQIAAALEGQGLEAAQWRFQRLPCITLRPGRPRSNTPKTTTPSAGERGRGYRRHQLTATSALGHLVRILAFRLFRLWPPRPACAIANRYFYDSFVHFDLTRRRTRLYAGLLSKLVPRPDLAILLVASPQTIAARRPQYSEDYIAHVHQAYGGLRQCFPDLMEVSSDPGQPTLERAEAAVLATLARSRR